MGERRLLGLDALRGIAALSVMVYHLPEYGTAELFPRAYLAVDFFFMLSGFVMARTYGERFGQGLTARAFLKKRYLRLWPVAAIGMAISLPLLHSYPPGFQLFLALSGILLVPVAWSGYLFPANAVAWSIVVELAANWLHGSLFWRCRRRILAGVAAAAFACMVLVVATRGDLNVGPRGADLALAIPRVIFAYLIGILIWQRFGDRPPAALPPAAAMLAMPALFFAFDHPLFDLAFVAMVCPVLLVSGIRASPPRALVLLGAMSYPLYAVQIPVLDVSRLAGLPWQAGAVLTLVAAAGIAMAGGPKGRFDRLAIRFRPRAGA